MNTDELFMQRAIDLAQTGGIYTAPNPMVGAVIVCEGKIIGEGSHRKYGEAHAEVNAVNSVENKELLKDSTIYVTLEPCAHFGKTPPCADLLIRHNFRRVVIGSRDPFEAVDGKGIEKLRAAGIETVTGVLENECLELNKRFFTFHRKKRPYIFLKWAETADGFMDLERAAADRKINWITHLETQVFVHKMRSEESAILTGWRTIANDNPELTVRAVEGKDPLRILIDRELKAPGDSKIFTDGKPVIVFNSVKNHSENGVSLVIPAGFSPGDIAAELFKLNLLSVIVEGGAETLNRFLDADLWDEAIVIKGETEFGTGLRSPLIRKKPAKQFRIGGDLVSQYLNS